MKIAQRFLSTTLTIAASMAFTTQANAADLKSFNALRPLRNVLEEFDKRKASQDTQNTASLIMMSQFHQNSLHFNCIETPRNHEL